MSPEESQTPEGGTVDLHSKVKEWLDQEGYPTEFTAASIFRRHEFRVHQGYYVRDDDSDAVREIDVLASKTASSRDYLIRAYHIVECKWSQDKPWVVLTSANASISHAACLAQTMGTLLGSTLLWALAGDKSLHAIMLRAKKVQAQVLAQVEPVSGDAQANQAEDHQQTSLIHAVGPIVSKVVDRRNNT